MPVLCSLATATQAPIALAVAIVVSAVETGNAQRRRTQAPHCKYYTPVSYAQQAQCSKAMPTTVAICPPHIRHSSTKPSTRKSTAAKLTGARQATQLAYTVRADYAEPAFHPWYTYGAKE